MLAQKLIVSYFTKIFIQFFSIIITLIVARIVGPEVLGTVAYGLAFAGMFKMISEFGVGTVHMKLLSEGKNFESCMGTYIRIKIVLILFFLVTVLTVYFLPKFLDSSFVMVEQDWVVLLSIIVITIEHFWTIPRVTFAAYTHQAKQDLPDAIYQFLYQVLRLLVVIIGYKAIAIVLSNLVAVIIVSLFYWYLFRSYPKGKFSKELSKEYLGTSLFILLMLLGQSIVNLTDVVLVKYFSTLEQVGFYSAGIRLSGFVKMIGQSVGLLFFPLFSRSLANQDFTYINNSINKYERFTMLFFFPFILLAVFHSDIIVLIFLGPDFVASGSIMAISFLTSFVYIITITYGNILSGNGSFGLLASIYIFSGIVYILLVLIIHLLLPGYSTSIIVSCSILFSNLLIGIAYLIFSKKLRNEICILPSKSILLSFMPLIIIWTICFHFVKTPSIQILISGLLLTSFYTFLWKLHILSSSDIEMLRELLNVKKAIDYIKGEMKSGLIKHEK